MEKLRILALIPTLSDDPSDTIKSLLEQTIKPSKILVAVGSWILYCRLTSIAKFKGVEYVYVKPDFSEPTGVRVAKALNHLLSRESIREYNYLLRVDADVILPQFFLEANLKLDADYVGRAGYAMLLKVDTFIKFFGKFPEIPAEDSYIGLKLIAYSANVKPYALPPILREKRSRMVEKMDCQGERGI